jgi:hypothetical protein
MSKFSSPTTHTTMENTMDAFKTSGTSPPQYNSNPHSVTYASVMRDPLFIQGVEEYRAHKRPDFDTVRENGHPEANWGYERGRQWAVLAPHHLKPSPRGLALLICKRSICP